MAGTWCLAFYLLTVLAGLYWSCEWYRNGLFRLLDGAPVSRQTQRGKPGGHGGRPADMALLMIDCAAIWNDIRQVGGDCLQAYDLRLLPAGSQPTTVFYHLTDAPYERVFSTPTLDPTNDQVKSDQRYSSRSFDSQLLTNVYTLYAGSYFGMAGHILMMLVNLAMPLSFITGQLFYLDRRRKKHTIRAGHADLGDSAGASDDPWLIGYASQSGFAEQLAWRSADQLWAVGLPVRVESLARLDVGQLIEACKASFVVSTFGDGEVPDNACDFGRKVLDQAASLDDLSYAPLALGDRQYGQFCGFARRAQDRLQGQGARSLLASVEVDDGDAMTLRQWQESLTEITGGAVPAA